MKSFLLPAALVMLSAPVAFAQDPPPPPPAGAPAATAPAAPAPAPAPAAPVTAEAPVARKEDETQQPGFVARVLAAAAGNKTVNAQLTEKDEKITALTNQVATLTKKLEAQARDIAEATAWIQGVANGSIDPVKTAAPTPAAAAAAQAVQTATSMAIQKAGIPVEALTKPEIPAVPAAETAPQQKDAARFAAIRQMWKGLGHEIPAPASNYGAN